MFEEFESECNEHCPLCGAPANEGCSDVLMNLDRSFGEIIDGYLVEGQQLFLDLFEYSFRLLLLTGENYKWDKPQIQEMWNWAHSNWVTGCDKTEEVVIDHYVLYDLLAELCYEHEDTCCEGEVDTETAMPGFASSYDRIYTNSPEQVVEDLHKSLKKYLWARLPAELP